MLSRFKTLLNVSLLLLGVVFLAEAQAYEVIDRFQVLEDKYRTYEMLNEYEHDFIFDISALLNTDATDFIDEAKDVADFEGTDTEKLNRAQRFLREYDKTEQNARISLTFGIPLFSFSAFGIEFKPSIRANANLGFLMGIQTTQLTTAQAIEYLGSSVPQYLKDALLSCSSGLDNGEDIVQYLIDTTACGLSNPEKTQAQAYVGKYFFPDDTSVPDIYNYIKGEARVGTHFQYKYDEHFFGSFALYALGRADYRVRVSAESLINDGDVVDLGEDVNTTINAAVDYHFGYRNGNLKAIAGIEDVKVANISNNDEEAGALLYGNDPLLRLHASYLYRFSAFSVKPFAGVHKRSSYGFDDGMYIGADLGAHVWDDRIGLRLRSMLDKEHFTFSPQAKLWLFHVDYMLKQPVRSEIDGVKPSTIHSLNIRFSI